MKYILFLLIILGSAQYADACSGDCVACHPKLLHKNGKMDNDHRILERCKRCHIDGTKIVMLDSNASGKPRFKTVKITDTNQTAHTECGNDCWQCHDIHKVGKIDIPEHRALPKCIACHIKLDKNVMNGDALFDDTPSPLGGNSLIDVLKK